MTSNATHKHLFYSEMAKLLEAGFDIRKAADVLKDTRLPAQQEALLKDLKEEEIDPALLQTKHNFYVIELSNVGGLVTPVVLKAEYTDGTNEEIKLPAEIWRFNTNKTSKLLLTKKEGHCWYCS